MNYRIIPVTAFAQNCSLIWCEQTRLAALVDPGGDAERIKQEVSAAGVSLMQILLTHGHLDHVGAAAELAQHYGVPIIGPEKEDEFWGIFLCRCCTVPGIRQGTWSFLMRLPGC